MMNIIKLIIKHRDIMRQSQQLHVQNYITLIDNYASPVNFKRLITDILNNNNINDKKEKIILCICIIKLNIFYHQM